MQAGIDRIGFYTSRYRLDLRELAEARGVEWRKYSVGLGQEVMGVPPPDEDMVTMAASAAKPILDAEGVDDIELLLVATESGVDQSKAAGMFVHGLLGLPARCRVVELKQACYSGTLALRFAALTVAANPDKKALVVASDIARYDLGSPGEPTQGCGAVAMLVTADPRLLSFDEEYGIHAEDVMDFWRPNYREEAVVDGKYSTRIYMHALKEAWRQYVELTGRSVKDFAKCCYHIPFTNMAVKGHERLLKAERLRAERDELIEAQVKEALGYNRLTGNTYTASLYEGLTCLLDTSPEKLDGRRIGMFSYGSGCVGEFFSGVVRAGYREHLFSELHKAQLESRIDLTVAQYEDIFNLRVPENGWEYDFAQYRTGPFRLSGVKEHKRLYEKLT